jgi:hypothetical protein
MLECGVWVGICWQLLLINAGCGGLGGWRCGDGVDSDGE